MSWPRNHPKPWRGGWPGQHLHTPIPGPDGPIWLLGCEVCHRPVGHLSLTTREEVLEHPDAGYVDALEKPMGWACQRSKGCERLTHSPIVCSDECERIMLFQHGLDPNLAGLEAEPGQQLALPMSSLSIELFHKGSDTR